ncbi:MAG TPA: TIR domain-containing protein [Candidatus Saccharimonadales bacterium]|nr:TIR domain-containing protein [Candidatus Saccharimonadales bacterium]
MAEKSLRFDTPKPNYDVFMSVADADRHKAQAVLATMQECGLSVFVDDGTNAIGTRNPTADQALGQSRLLVPYYSEHFARQARCQRALMAAFLAGHHSGEPTKYIATINPEDPVSAHIVPIEVADIRYATRFNLPAALPALKAKAVKNTAPIGAAPHPKSPRWIGSSPDTTHSAERYAKLWQLHSALEIGNYPLMSDTVNPHQIARVAGDSGTGKTDLVATYAQLFGAQYQGGVYWTSLQNCPPTYLSVYRQYIQELRRISTEIDLPATPPSRDQLLGHLAHYLSLQEAPSLWIVDDMPENLDEHIIADGLFVPEPRLHTILISNQRCRA